MNQLSGPIGSMAAHQADPLALMQVGASSAKPPVIVVMGVCGCGKSTVGAQLAAALGLAFLEGDTLHPTSNVALMAAGVALSDADRAGWLHTLSDRLGDACLAGTGLVMSCSALKRAYRDILRKRAPDLHFVCLHGDHDLLASRMAARTGHFMPLSLLISQLATLEVPDPDEKAQFFDVATRPEVIVTKVTERFSLPN